jgi:hypothetical protein
MAGGWGWRGGGENGGFGWVWRAEEPRYPERAYRGYIGAAERAEGGRGVEGHGMRGSYRTRQRRDLWGGRASSRRRAENRAAHLIDGTCGLGVHYFEGGPPPHPGPPLRKGRGGIVGSEWCNREPEMARRIALRVTR